MNFTNSPYEALMKEPSYLNLPPSPAPAPEGTKCHGCPYWKGIACVFCYREKLNHSGR